MKRQTSSLRIFVAGTLAFTAASSFGSDSMHRTDVSSARSFVSAWDSAWANHDARALGSLHTEAAVTVNRFGTLVDGRKAIQEALAFLHENNGPFSHSKVPPQQIIDVRQIAPTVMTVHTKWQSPVMNPNGKIDPAKTNDMIVTFVLLKTEAGWKATDVDLHNVEKMDLPFSNPGQH